MKRHKNLLFKTFALSLFVHIAGISLFALVFPPPQPEMEPIEVSILPPSAAPEEPAMAKAEPALEIPSITIKEDELQLALEQQPVQLAQERFMGFPEYIPVSQITRKFEVPEFQIQLPDIISFTRMEELAPPPLSDIQIEGPAGDRRLLHRERAEYPEWAQERGIEGNVRIRFWVDPDGTIALTTLLGSSGFPELDIHAEQTIRRWLFQPATTQEQAWGIITFRFRLQ